MPLSAPDPVIALIAVDLQRGKAGHPLSKIVDRARELIDAFRAKELSVAVVNVVGRPSGARVQHPEPLPPAWGDGDYAGDHRLLKNRSATA